MTTGLVRVRSPLLAESRLMSFPPGTEMFQFPGFASRPYGFRPRYLLRGGLPHSEILGSKPARGSPKLFAACHVLRRLLAPRHPPDALAFLDPPQRQPHQGGRRCCGQTKASTYKKHTHAFRRTPSDGEGGRAPCLPAPARATIGAVRGLILWT